jgi:N-methylhydantoinase A/oxoprolinase/acetone carboxylase beta subunit
MDDVFVADMGGTTTDIAILRAGQPVLNENGANIGGWKTMVEAVSVHTSGLGGDSQITWEKSGNMFLGPVRIIPLSLLAHQYPIVLTTLRQQVSQTSLKLHDGQFALSQRPLDVARENLTPFQAMVWEALADGPVALDLLLASEVTMLKSYALERLVERGLVVISGFTPTDAAHVLGYTQEWSLEGALLGAEILARQAGTCTLGSIMQAHDLCQKVVNQMTVQAGKAIVSAVLAEGYHLNMNDKDSLGGILVDQALAGKDDMDALMEVELTLRRPLVAIGAPVRTYYPAVAERLHTRLIIPNHAGIANAIGAVAGSVMQTVRAFIKPLAPERFRVHLPVGIQDFDNFEEAIAYATEAARDLASAHARYAGASSVQVQINRKDQIVDSSSGAHDGGFFLGTEVKATAIGRPKLTNG